MRSFVQRSPVVFGATLGLVVVVGLLFVLLPSGPVRNHVPGAREASQVRSAEGKSKISGKVDDTLAPRPPKAEGSMESMENAAAQRHDSSRPKPAREGISAGQPAVSPKTPGGGFTVQVGSFVSESAAKQLAAKLENSGYPAFVKRARVPGKGSTYRVRVGRFADREAARRYGERLVAQRKTVKTVFATIND